MDDRMKKVLVGVVLGIVLVVLLIIILGSGVKKPNCDLAEAQPPNEAVKNLATKDNKNLANFVGNLKFVKSDKDKDPKKVYLTLKLDGIELSKDSNKLSLESECASIELETADNSRVSAMSVAYTDVDGKSQKCSVVEPNINWAKEKHYSCQKPKTYNCVAASPSPSPNPPPSPAPAPGPPKDDAKLIAVLTVSDLEFEINGKPDSIKDGKFSTDADICK